MFKESTIKVATDEIRQKEEILEKVNKARNEKEQIDIKAMNVSFLYKE